MKRFFAATLVILFMFTASFSVSVFASSNTCDLDELGLVVSFPSDYSIITRDTPASDPIFSDLGTTKSAIMDHFEKSNIHLNAVSDTYNEEVVVTMVKNNINNFSVLSDDALNALASVLVKEYSNYGINVSDYEIYNHSQAKFVRIYFTDTYKTVHGLQYYTIYDGKAMNFTIRSYEGSLSSRQKSTIKKIVDSIKYDNAPPVVDAGEETDPFDYTDMDSGVIFTVPANWKQEEFVKDREAIDVKFVSTKQNECIMIYGSTDIWEEMTTYDKIGYNRSDINNSAFTASEIAEIYNTTEDKITTVTYNGVQYFKGEIKKDASAFGLDITIVMTQLVYIDNGWMYSYQFGGSSSHKLYPDFEKLLESVQYPDYFDVEDNSSVASTNSDTVDDSDDNSGVITIVILLVAFIIVAVIIAIVRKNNAASIAPASDMMIYEKPIPQEESDPEQAVFCRNCGQKLSKDSKFCHVCGTEVRTEEQNG